MGLGYVLLAVCGVKNFRISVKTLFFLVLLGISAFEPGLSVFGEDWVLAGQKFSFAQKGGESSASARLAEVLPQLILEQVAENSIRSVSAQEQLDRELYSLQTERLSLFLQLSKEYKTRDALLLSKNSVRELKKAVKSEEEKIEELEKKIDQNLSDTEKVREKFAGQVAFEKGVSPAEGEGNGNEKDAGFFENFRFPFARRRQGEFERVSENVVIYKNDPSVLFSVSDAAGEGGIESFAFNKEVSAAKINALLTGKISLYGEYVSVTVQLYLFPGGNCQPAVTEVGNVNDLASIAQNLSRNLMPQIANSLPVRIKIEIEPPEAAKTGIVSVDGVIVPAKEDIVVDAGVHSITVSASGFEKQTVNYGFAGEDFFTVKTTLRPLVMGSLDICLKKMAKGVFYFNALNSSEVDGENLYASSTVNGRPILGVFENSEGETAFIYIPEKLAKDENTLTINARPFNREESIDRQRRRMYTAYSALICSLVPTFFTVGNFTAVNNSYSAGRAGFDEVSKWQKYSYYSIGVSCAAGAWFAFEMVRYLFTANEVLPATAGSKK